MSVNDYPGGMSGYGADSVRRAEEIMLPRFVMLAIRYERTIMRWLLAAAAFILLMTGCKSSRSVSGRTSGAAGKLNQVDYSREVTDPVARALIAEAQKWIGTRYLYGGDTRDGTDCSGLVMRVFGDVCGVKIPRSTREQVKYCTKVARNNMQPGDLVFFGSEKSDDKVSHVGLYVGEGKMIHASSSRGVMVSGFDSGYWGDRYFTGGRIEKVLGHSYATSSPSSSSSSTPSSSSSPSISSSSLGAIAPALSPGPVAPEVSPAEVPEVESEIPEAVAPVGVSPTATIDLLDLIINQKVDSIFSNQFAD